MWEQFGRRKEGRGKEGKDTQQLRGGEGELLLHAAEEREK